MIVTTSTDEYKLKEELYLAVRTAENRVLDDEMVRQLPQTPSSYVHHNEWQIRAAGLKRFIAYLDKKFGEKKLNILDVGCGNGWMSNNLHKHGHKVTGIDLNLAELEQAERVFGTSESMAWQYVDILNDDVTGAPFDIILFGASCQYFPDISVLTEASTKLLTKPGEIHLLDSFFYKDSELDAARSRTEQYYSQMGFPEMSEFYHHHSVNALKAIGYKKLFPGFWDKKGMPEWWSLKYA